MLPTFLGIGVNKAATTWLHGLLDSHPHVWMPSRRKEVHFFTRHFEKGVAWYERYFPEAPKASRYEALGEYTPAYLYDDQCPARIATIPSIEQFILSLRNPVDRAYSAYGHLVRNYDYRASFETFLEEHPNEIERGMYARHLKNYLRHFERDQFLILRFDDLFDDIPATRKTIADFLEIDADLFPDEAGEEKLNASFVPRFRRAFAAAQSVMRTLRKWEMGGVLNWVHRTGIGPAAKRLFGERDKEKSLSPIEPETRARLAERYASDIEALEALTGTDFSHWKRDLSL